MVVRLHQPSHPRRRRVAVALLLVGSVGWAVALLAAPYVLTQGGFPPAVVRGAASVYAFGSVVCHQQPDRSFRAWGLSLPVCARCAGLYAAAPLGVLLGALVGGGIRRSSPRETARGALVAAALPTLISVVAEYGLGLTVSGPIRASAAAPLALTAAWVVVLAIRGELDPEPEVH